MVTAGALVYVLVIASSKLCTRMRRHHAVYYCLRRLYNVLSCRVGSCRIVSAPLPFSCCQVAVAVFAIPTGIFGAGFEAMIEHRKQHDKEEQASLQEDAAVAEGESSAWGTADASTELIGAGGGQRPSFSFLDTGTNGGRRYRNVLLTVVVLNIIALFSSTLDYFQVCLLFSYY